MNRTTTYMGTVYPLPKILASKAPCCICHGPNGLCVHTSLRPVVIMKDLAFRTHHDDLGRPTA